MKWDILEGSAHTPMYNPNILPLKYKNMFLKNQVFGDNDKNKLNKFLFFNGYL